MYIGLKKLAQLSMRLMTGIDNRLLNLKAGASATTFDISAVTFSALYDIKTV